VVKFKRLAAILAVAMCAVFVAQPAQAATDPKGPGCKRVLFVVNCDAENWYQDVRGYGMELSKDRLARGMVAVLGSYVTSGTISSLDTVVEYYGNNARFRLCARDAVVAFASQVAKSKDYTSSFNALFKSAKVVPIAGKAVSSVWTGTKTLLIPATKLVLASQARIAASSVIGC